MINTVVNLTFKKKSRNFFRDYKIELSNICFYSKSRKKKYLFRQTFKKKISQIYFKKSNKKNLKWDFDRKLVLFKTKIEKPKNMVNIGSNTYFYPETVFFFNYMKSRNFFRYRYQFKLEIKPSCVEIFEFSNLLVHLCLESWNFFPHRFGLHRKRLIKPVFICFHELGGNCFLLNILNLNNYHSFSFPISLTILAFRLKPGILKMVVNGTFGLLFFSLNFGFSSFCPIFIKKKKMVVRKMN
jgi:hypothetical protein